MQRGIGEIQVGDLHDRRCIEARDLGRDRDVVGEVEVALASPSLSRMLCEIQQWSLDQYSAWLEDTLVRTLLD
jgi:hypothetical protein